MTPVVVQNRYLFIGGFNKRSMLLELNSEKPGVTLLMRDRPKCCYRPSTCNRLS